MANNSLTNPPSFGKPLPVLTQYPLDSFWLLLSTHLVQQCLPHFEKQKAPETGAFDLRFLDLDERYFGLITRPGLGEWHRRRPGPGY